MSSTNISNLCIEKNSIGRWRWWCTGYSDSRNFDFKRTSSSEYCAVSIHERNNSITKDFVFVFRLRDVILTDARLYLIFEYLAMDLKKYLDCLGENEDMDVALIRVRRCWACSIFKSNVFSSRVITIKSLMLYSFVIVVELFIGI